ncbi:hypothetical protein N1028_03585 [Herbiconiux sp. CPCC 203407]|uniref:Uncharacterized protein n=1 Tax=Herbiconiux oxytropis TaxID=2970915 RepID=A0AA42BS84_9MICO|nr:hypothetical protein [Herbiconiux oxytropis]MCS5720703.1 hypothetical protein [Herbiconiux oxytropis]MCS5724970.1 hypothetical protein [Herbiconiux oxytropis]
MAALSFAEAQARVLALNSDELPFVYEPAPYGIRAAWKYADVKWAAITAAGTISGDYELRVTLDPESSTWTFDETRSESRSTVQSDGGGGFSASFGSSGFKGRQKSASFQFGVGSAASTTDRQGTHEGNTYGYSFTTDEVKEPLIAALESAGWERARKGLFGKLFGG